MNALTHYVTLRLFLDGMLCMMALYVLLAYVQQRKAIYWQYALYIGCMVLDFRLADIGYSRPGYQPGAFYPETFVESMAYVLYLRFAMLLMDMKHADPTSYRVLRWMIAAFLVSLGIDTVLWLADAPTSLRSGVYLVNRGLICLAGAFVVPRIFRLHDPVVSYFIIGSVCVIVCSVLALATNYVELGAPLSATAVYPVAIMQIGIVAEVLFFTLGMSLRNRQTEREKIQVQAQLIEQLRENERKQQKLQRIRDDIARDLHDEIGSELSAVSLLSKTAARQVRTHPDHVVDVLQTISQTSRQILNSLRDIVWSLNSTQSTYDNLSFRMREAAYALFEHTPIQLHFDLADQLPEGTMPADHRRELFLLYKETLHNILRHAQARNVRIRLRTDADRLYLSVEDDGVGLPAGASTGSGLRFLHQRADAIDGQVAITSTPGQGTTVACWCPLVSEPEVSPA